MSRKLFIAALFAIGCVGTIYAASAEAVEEAPAPRAVDDGKKGEGKGKFGGFGKFDPEKFKDLKGKIDPEKLKELKEKFGGKGFDPEKFKGKFDPEKLKELKGKFEKGGFGKGKKK